MTVTKDIKCGPSFRGGCLVWDQIHTVLSLLDSLFYAGPSEWSEFEALHHDQIHSLGLFPLALYVLTLEPFWCGLRANPILCLVHRLR